MLGGISSFNLFPSWPMIWSIFHVLIGHLYILSGEALRSFAYFLSGYFIIELYH